MEKEIEYKALITEENYKNLIVVLEQYFSGEKYIHINYYYDTLDLYLHRKHETLRIRSKKDELKLEYKFNKKEVGFARISEEKSLPIVGIPDKLNDDIIELLGLPKRDYIKLGNLITERIDYHSPCGIITLDKNKYFDFIDYEIEIEIEEVPSNNNTIMCPLINFDQFKQPIHGKYSRFINQYLNNSISSNS